MATITEIPTDFDSVVDDVIDGGGDGIEKSLTTDSKPEIDSDLKTKSEPEFDQMKKLVAMFKKLNPEAKEFFPSHKKNNNLSPDDFMIAKKPSGEEFNGDNKKDGINRRVTIIFWFWLNIWFSTLEKVSIFSCCWNL